MRIADTVAPARLGGSFRWLLASSWTSNLGDGIALTAAPLLVTSQTRDPVLVGLAVTLQRLPWLLFGLVAGVTADRFDRRRIVVAVQSGRAVLLAVVSVAVALDAAGVTFILVATFLFGTAETFADTTSATLLPMVVEPSELGLGNARLMAGFVTLNTLVGPPVGAVLFAAGAVIPFAVQAVCMALSALLAARVRLPAHGVDKADRSHPAREVAQAWRWLWHNAPVRTLTLTIVTFNVTYGAAWAVLVLYATERLGAGEVGYGLLTAAVAVGGLVGTGLYGWLANRVSLGNLMRAGLIIETLSHLALALTTTAWVALVIMTIFGVHAFVWATTSRTVRQRTVPTELQGRVGSVYLIGVQGGLVVGSAIGGVIAGAWGVTAPLWFAFAGSAVLVALIWPQMPHIIHADEAALRAARTHDGH